MTSNGAAAAYPFPRTARLLSSSDYRLVLRRGRCWRRALFVLYVMENGLTVSRLGITVSRKVGKAVQRNRIKRVVREFFRLESSQWRVMADHVFIARPAAAGVENVVLRRELEQLLVYLSRP
ncbi:MAG: ribonuclease P protein component [Magnetococcales bacterium]|nr:ribonuclease P protein component [Magnetococcales bacterium]